MKELLDKSIEMAYKGREDWINLISEFNIGDNDYVVLFPKIDREINDIAVKYVKKLTEKGKVLLLAHDDVLLNLSDVKGLSARFYSREDAENLMKFYALYQFTDRLIIVSLEEPEGRTGKNLTGVNGITVEELIAVGIFGMEICK